MENKFLSVYLVLFLSITTAYAELTGAKESDAQAGSSPSSLPNCIEDSKTIQNIEETMKANRRSPHKYNGYADALKNSSDLELASRLAYAEVLAANCNEHNSQLVRPITEVIANRIALRKNNARKVVFERDQFASSLNKYDSSRYKDFLCPKDTQLWNEVQTQMELALQKPKNENQRLLPTDGVHYYFFQHDKKFTPPAWAEGKKAYPTIDFQDSSKLNSCAKFYRNPKFK